MARLSIETTTLPAVDRSMTVFGFRLSGQRLSEPLYFENGSTDRWISQPLAPGAYILEQRALPDDWRFASLTCDGRTVAGGAIVLETGKTTRCVLTNKRSGRIVVKTRSQPARTSTHTDFSLVNTSGSLRRFSLNEDEQTVFLAPEGVYSLYTSGQRNHATEVTCESETSPRRIIVAPGQTVVCTATVTNVDLAMPELSIDVTPGVQVALAGATPQFEVTVRNTGNIDLTGIKVVSPAIPGCERTIPWMRAASPPLVYSCEASALRASVTNQLTVSSDQDARASATARVNIVDRLNPSVRVSVIPDRYSVPAGQPVRFTVTVINVGNTPLTGLKITSSRVPSCSRDVNVIRLNNRLSYQCTKAATNASFSKVVSVTSSEGASSRSGVYIDVIGAKVSK